MKGKIPSLITILILTTLTSIMWISLGVYRAIVVKPSSSVPEEISKPLTPSLNQNTINEILGRLFLSDDQIPTTVITSATPSAIPSPTPSVTPTSTISPEPTIGEETPLPEELP